MISNMTGQDGDLQCVYTILLRFLFSCCLISVNLVEWVDSKVWTGVLTIACIIMDVASVTSPSGLWTAYLKHGCNIESGYSVFGGLSGA